MSKKTTEPEVIGNVKSFATTEAGYKDEGIAAIPFERGASMIQKPNDSLISLRYSLQSLENLYSLNMRSSKCASLLFLLDEACNLKKMARRKGKVLARTMAALSMGGFLGDVQPFLVSHDLKPSN